MNRRQFFKRAAIVAAGAAAAPLVGKAPEAPEAVAGTEPVSTAESLAWANRTAHSSPSRVPSYTFTASTDSGYYRVDEHMVAYAINGSKAYEWYDDDGGSWKNAIPHPHGGA